MVTLLTGRAPTLETVRDLSARYGAAVFETRDVNSDETIALVQRVGSDVIVVMNFDQILHERLISVPSWGVLNVHPSLLPDFRGPCPVFWALAGRRAEAGASVHFIADRRIDNGSILEQRTVILDRSRSVAETTCSLFKLGVQCVPGALERLRRGEQGSPQSETSDHYQGFPTRLDVLSGRREGVRLCRLLPVLRLLCSALGGWPFDESAPV
jgi:methionyl-tRNA formyltransferase